MTLGNETPSITSVITNAAKEVLSRKHPEVHGKNDLNTPQWAQIRTAGAIGPTLPKNNRMAQMMSSGYTNNTVTQPSFYSPFLTPQSFQIPNTRKEMYLWANFWYQNNPKVAAGINFYTNFPFNGWKLECKSPVVKDYYEKLLNKLNFHKILPAISRSYHLYGDAFVFMEIDCAKCKGLMQDPQTGEPCDHKGATWKSMSVLDPSSVLVTPGFISSTPSYSYLPSQHEIQIVATKQPLHLYNQIPEGIRKMILSNQPIPLHPDCIYHFKHGADEWADYGTSLVKPLFGTLAYQDKLRTAQWIVAERHILPTKIVQVGDNERPASQADLDSVQEQLAEVANDPNLTLVVPHAFDYKFVGASGSILDIKGEFENINQDLLDGLMLNKGLLNGEGPAYGNAQVGLLSMNERLETWRREVAQYIGEKIFRPCSEWNDFYATGEGGQSELIYPKIIFDPLKLKDNTGTLQMLVTSYENGAISAETLVEEFGLNWDQEVERKRFEQGMNFINSADVSNTDMNIGFNGVTGNGFGAGINDAGPGVPLTGGGAPGMGGDMAPGADMGGMPPVGGEVAPAPAPGATASSIYEQYRFASRLMNEIQYNQKIKYSLDNSDDYKYKLDEELNPPIIVSGRSYVGEIPEDLPEVTPWNFRGSGIPLNYEAQRTAGKKNEQQPKFQFNNLEKKLYKIVMSLNLPLAFFAQYAAGPNQKYILDGAFPDIKLALEADGEVWHNNPDKIQSDRNRDIALSQQGWTVLRFTDAEIDKKPQDVAQVISQAFQQLQQNKPNQTLEFKKYV